MRYLLDTNVVSDLVRNPQGKVAQRIRKVGEARVCTSIIVAAELRYGAATANTSALLTLRLWVKCLCPAGGFFTVPTAPPILGAGD